MIFESLRLSQNFVKFWNFSWPQSLVKFQILTTFSTFSDQFSRFALDSYIVSTGLATISEISDFDHFLNILKSHR